MKKKFGLIFLFLISLMLLQINMDYGDSYTNILILNSYDSENVWTKSQIKGIIDKLDESKLEYNLYIEYMDVRRFDDEAHLKQIFNYLYNKYLNQEIDYIIATDDSAFSFLNSNSEEIFGDSKIIFSGLNYIYDMDRSRFTGIYEKIDIKSNVEFALELFPQTENIYLIGEDQLTTKSISLEVDEYISQLEDMNFEILLSKDVDFLRENIGLYPENSIIFFTIFNKDMDGNIYNYEKGFNKILSGVELPVFSFWSFYDGLPIVGGYISDPILLGEDVGDITIELIGGSSVEDIEIEESRKVYKLNYETLEKFGIEKVKIDKEIEYINKPKSIFEIKYLNVTIWLIIILVLVVLILLIKNRYYLKENARLRAESDILDITPMDLKKQTEREV